MEKKYDLAAATEAEIISDIEGHLEEVEQIEKPKKYDRRTSTPTLERRRCTIQCFRKDGYEKWCDSLEKSNPMFKVRGISFSPGDIISGNLIPFAKEKEPDKSDSDLYEKNPANQRLDYHSDTLKKLLLSVVSDHCKSLLKKTLSLVKYNNKSIHPSSDLD